MKVNVDEDPELAKLFSVNSFPKLMIWSKRFQLKSILQLEIQTNALILVKCKHKYGFDETCIESDFKGNLKIYIKK